MVYRGKPSAGCENCRKAKKRCGLEQPACARCVKLKKTCSGYRDTTALQIQDESEAVRQKANRQKVRTSPSTSSFLAPEPTTKIENGIATPGSTSAHTPFSETSSSSDEIADLVLSNGGQLVVFDASSSHRGADSSEIDTTFEIGSTFTIKPTADELATTYFYTQFTANNGHWRFLREQAQHSSLDPVINLAIRACGMAALDNVQGVVQGRDYSRMCYGEALGLLNSTLRDAKRSRTDESLVAVSMLGYFENLTCDSRQSIQSWKAHISGATQLLKLRGKGQFKTIIGRTLFREIRAQIIIQCMWDDTEPASFLYEWESELEKYHVEDDLAAPVDRFTRLCFEYTALRSQMTWQTISEPDAMDKATQLEMQMVQWSIDTMEKHESWRYYDLEVRESPHVWNGVVHAYTGFPVASVWNTYRSIRIMLTRTQELLYRRLHRNLKDDDAQLAYFRSIRRQMTDEICSGIPTQLGHASPAFNSPCIIITAYGSIWPLFFAGTCTLERIGESHFSGAGPIATSAAAAQTAWIIDRMDYISSAVGIRWSEGIAATLKGDFALHEDLMEDQDKRYIQMYWKLKGRREARELGAPEPQIEDELPTMMPAWVAKIHNAGKVPKVAVEQATPDTNDDLELQRTGDHGPIWLGRDRINMGPSSAARLQPYRARNTRS